MKKLQAQQMRELLLAMSDGMRHFQQQFEALQLEEHEHGDEGENTAPNPTPHEDSAGSASLHPEMADALSTLRAVQGKAKMREHDLRRAARHTEKESLHLHQAADLWGVMARLGIEHEEVVQALRRESPQAWPAQTPRGRAGQEALNWKDG